MKKLMSILCSIAFATCGVMMAITANDLSPGYSKTITAATMPTYHVQSTDTNTLIIPQDLLLDLTVRNNNDIDSSLVDSLKCKIKELEQREPVTKIKKVPVVKHIVKRDTIYKDHYYIATKIGSKETDSEGCVSVYEVHEVDKICPEEIKTSIDNNVGD